MTAEELQQNLLDWSIKNSRYDEHRGYIGLSGIYDCSRMIFRRFFKSSLIPVKAHLRTRYCYELEGVIKDRLKGMGVLGIGKEISAYGGKVQGHTDGEIGGKLLEIKTVPRSEFLPTDGIPRKVSWQVQAYMFYGQYEECLVLYFGRDEGQFKTYEVPADQGFGKEIDAKVKMVLDCVTRRVSPMCDCGRCEGLP